MCTDLAKCAQIYVNLTDLAVFCAKSVRIFLRTAPHTGCNAFVLLHALARFGLCFVTCDFRVLFWMYYCTKCYELANVV